MCFEVFTSCVHKWKHGWTHCQPLYQHAFQNLLETNAKSVFGEVKQKTYTFIKMEGPTRTPNHTNKFNFGSRQTSRPPPSPPPREPNCSIARAPPLGKLCFQLCPPQSIQKSNFISFWKHFGIFLNEQIIFPKHFSKCSYFRATNHDIEERKQDS